MFQNRKEFSLWRSAAPFANPALDALPEHGEYNCDDVWALTNVSMPSVTCFPVAGNTPHPAVLVCPGGGYSLLAYDMEGSDICAMLNAAGFTAFLLKYRCPDQRLAAHADAARAMRLIRAKAAEFKVIPDKVGIIGFSAGAHLAATVCAPADPVPYEPTDEIDRFSYRPEFAALIYPAYLANPETLELAPEFKVSSDAPPAFLAQAENDPIRVEMSLAWYLALKRANVPAEMHLFADGGHGYGLRRTGNPIAEWGNLAAQWMRRQVGML